MEIAYFNIYGSVNTQMEEICDRFPIWAIRDVSPKNLMWKLANRNKLPEGGLESLFVSFIQMNDIGYEKYRSKHQL